MIKEKQNLPGASYDNKIYAKFSKNTIEKKALNKEAFMKEFRLIQDKKTLLIGITQELTQKNGFKILKDILDGIHTINASLAIRGVGTKDFQELIINFAESNPGKIAILEDTEENMRKIYASSDVSLFLSDSKNIDDALSYASIVIAPRTIKRLNDYNPNLEKGNSFLFEEGNQWSVFEGLVRANENHKFPYDWKTICKNAIG
jgi:starch synthase